MRCLVPVGKDDWETPIELFNKLDEVFQFEIDAAASRENALCREYYSLDGVNAFRANPVRKQIFLNPPYSMKKEFINIAKTWSTIFGNEVVLLLPASTDTEWFYEAMLFSHETCLLKGRVQFSGQKNNPGGSALFIMNSCLSERGLVSIWDWKNEPFDERIIF